jgi:hypothetical protein
MRVLVACEFSGTVRDAFTARGHAAVSCDLLPSEAPGLHIQGDVREIINDGWDLIIAHPPCTHLSAAGACRLYHDGIIDAERLEKGLQAKAFFELFLSTTCSKVCIENPTPLRVFDLPVPTQVIQPWQFGHPVSKRTLLWLRGLPPLKPTKIVECLGTFLPSNTGGARRGQMSRTDKALTRDPRIASKTFQGIADAMADQWGALL